LDELRFTNEDLLFIFLVEEGKSGEGKPSEDDDIVDDK
jgi:hypothetical protein